MRAVILAAGMGKRFGMSIAKCTIKVGEETLIQRLIRLIQELGLESIVVVGYRHKDVKKFIPGVKTIYNDKFERGSTYSLYLARDYFPDKEPFIFLQSDLLFHKRLLEECIHAHGSRLVVGPRHEHSNEEIVVQVKEGIVINMERGSANGLEWRGIVRVAPEDRMGLLHVLEQDVSYSLDTPLWKSLRTFCTNASVRILHSDAPWTEIDFPKDLIKAREEIWTLVQNE